VREEHTADGRTDAERLPEKHTDEALADEERLGDEWLDEARVWPQRNEAFYWARVEAGLSQGELAAEVHACRQTISDIERRTRTPSVSLALALAGRLGRTVEELFAPTDLH
jgi:putative transcriptional regulator